MSEQGVRSVLGNLLTHVSEFGSPDPKDSMYGKFIDQWSDRLLKSSGFFRMREEVESLKDCLTESELEHDTAKSYYQTLERHLREHGCEHSFADNANGQLEAA